MPEPGDNRRGFFAAIRHYVEELRRYAEERKRPRVCPVCGDEVMPISDGKLFACSKATCGWQGTTPYRG